MAGEVPAVPCIALTRAPASTDAPRQPLPHQLAQRCLHPQMLPDLGSRSPWSPRDMALVGTTCGTSALVLQMPIGMGRKLLLVGAVQGLWVQAARTTGQWGICCFQEDSSHSAVIM